VKYLSIILALYVLLLSIKPCLGDDNDTSVKTEQSSHQDKDCNDVCSPFFICGTCSGFTLNISLVNFSATPFFIESNYPDYKQSSLSEVFISIWQPPKIS
jgi:hypothetical protein